MELDPWEWQPGHYASVAITHKAVRHGRGAGRPPTLFAFHPTSVKNRYTLLPVFLHYLSLSLSVYIFPILSLFVSFCREESQI